MLIYKYERNISENVFMPSEKIWNFANFTVLWFASEERYFSISVYQSFKKQTHLNHDKSFARIIAEFAIITKIISLTPFLVISEQIRAVHDSVYRDVFPLSSFFPLFFIIKSYNLFFLLDRRTTRKNPVTIIKDDDRLFPVPFVLLLYFFDDFFSIKSIAYNIYGFFLLFFLTECSHSLFLSFFF